MSGERMTEVELAAYEAAAKGLVALTDPDDAPTVHMAERVCAEVRRLRELILKQDSVNDDTYLIHPEFAAEVRAIREEGKP